MPSSISSSSQRIPSAPYGRLWLLTAVLVVALGLGLEVTLRRLGHIESVTDDATSWSSQFDLVVQNKADVVLVGASRLQLGFSREAFGSTPDLVVSNISMGGESPVASLRLVAEETDFDGLVICSLAEYHLSMDATRNVARRLADYRRRFVGPAGLDSRANSWLSTWLQETLVIFSANIRLRELAMSRRLFEPRAIRWDRDRFGYGYYREILSPARLQDTRQRRSAEVRTVLGKVIESAWETGLADLATSVARIRARGGTVVFVRYPTSGELGEALRSAFPRRTYWDSISPHTGAVTVHFEDYPQLSGFECPEGSHLNWNDARLFSAGLAEVLSEKGLLVERSYR